MRTKSPVLQAGDVGELGVVGLAAAEPELREDSEQCEGAEQADRQEDSEAPRRCRSSCPSRLLLLSVLDDHGVGGRCPALGGAARGSGAGGTPGHSGTPPGRTSAAP